MLVELGEKCAVSIAFCGRQSSGVSGGSRIEKEVDSRAKGIGGEGSQGST